MRTRHKIVIGAAALAAIVALGVVLLKPNYKPVVSAEGVKVIGVRPQACASAQLQCPYYGCPYLYRLHEMAEGKKPQSGNAVTGCPYESGKGLKAKERAANKPRFVMADAAIPNVSHP